MTKKRVLIAPLNWGLGHATRCIPIVREFLLQGAEVIIGSEGDSLKILQEEFPSLESVELPAYNISYPANGNMALSIALQIPSLRKAIRKEHEFLEVLIETKKIDLVVSDNRYGLWSKKIPCVFMTHQVMIACPTILKFLQPILFSVQKHFIKHFSEFWIPDVEGENNLSGDLAHAYSLPSNTHFIGALSRFDDSLKEEKSISSDLLVILSGPEPQRSIFENIVLEQLKNFKGKSVLLRGKPGEISKQENSTTQIFSHLDSSTFAHYLRGAKMILSRPGYSSLMDYAVFNKRAILIPTPGQTEQEYLADFHKKNGKAYSENQNEFSLERCLEKVNEYKGFSFYKKNKMLETRVQNLLIH